jgi:hypothetical protein
MPVTPFHIGPALIANGLTRNHFSLGTFALVQVVIDIEAVYNILLGHWPVHTTLHTMLGATAVAVLAALCRRPISWVNRTVLGRWARARAAKGSGEPAAGSLHGLAIATIEAELAPVTWTGALVGAVLGVLLHVPIDAMMHPDVKPFAPWSDANPLFIPGSFEWLHVACLVAGLLGLGLWARRVRRRVPTRA